MRAEVNRIVHYREVGESGCITARVIALCSPTGEMVDLHISSYMGVRYAPGVLHGSWSMRGAWHWPEDCHKE